MTDRLSLQALITRWRAQAQDQDLDADRGHPLDGASAWADGYAQAKREDADDLSSVLSALPRQHVDSRYLHGVADRIIEMQGACAHDWLVGVARHIKSALPRQEDPPGRLVTGYVCGGYECGRTFYLEGHEEASVCPVCSCSSVSELVGPFAIAPLSAPCTETK